MTSEHRRKTEGGKPRPGFLPIGATRGLFLVLFLWLLAGCTTTASDSLPYTLDEGQTQRGDLRVVGGNATLESSSRLAGSVYMTHGSLQLGPQAVIAEDIVMLSGSLFMDNGAKVEGDVVMLSGRLALQPEAAILGELTTNTSRVIQEIAARLLQQALLVFCLPILGLAALVLLIIGWQRRKARRKLAGSGVTQA